jgi:hypothetical protein
MSPVGGGLAVDECQTGWPGSDDFLGAEFEGTWRDVRGCLVEDRVLALVGGEMRD